jgi:hypothetical protein
MCFEISLRHANAHHFSLSRKSSCATHPTTKYAAAHVLMCQGGEQAGDFNAFATAWNEHVDKLEADVRAGTLEVQKGELPVMRKHAAELRKYWRVSQADTNMKRTLHRHLPAQQNLRYTLRQAEELPDNAAPNSTDALSAPANVRVSGGSVTFPRMMLAGAAPTASAMAGVAGTAPAYVPPIHHATAASVRASAPQFGRKPAATTL